MPRKYGKSGNIAERNFRKLCESQGIELEDGSPAKSSDFTIFPNLLVEVKSTTGSSFSFKQAHRKGREFSRGEQQLHVLQARKDMHPWIEVIYAVYYSKMEVWRWFPLPGEPKALHHTRGKDIMILLASITQSQAKFARVASKWQPIQDANDLNHLTQQPRSRNVGERTKGEDGKEIVKVVRRNQENDNNE